MTPKNAENTQRTALVVSGGGSKGAFAVGAIEVLRERGTDFDLICGTSTGSLIAPLVAIDRLDVAHNIYTHTRTKDILRLNIGGFFRRSIYDPTPLRHLLERQVKTLDLFRALQNSHRRILICTVNLQSGQAEYWSQRKGPGVHLIDNKETLVACLLASANEPIFTPPVEISTGGHVNQHLDGGIRDIAPLSIAIDHGARRVFAIALSPEEVEPTQKPYTWLLPIGARTLDLMTQEILQNDIKRARSINDALAAFDTLRQRAEERFGPEEATALFADALPRSLAGKHALEISVIRPATPLTANPLTFDPDEMTEMLRKGRAAATMGG